MAQTAELVKTLKRALKTHGKTYAAVSRDLGLSEASVKRLFSRGHFTLERLDQICQMLDMEISDLVQLMNENQQTLQQLTIEQEREVTNDTALLVVAICVLNKWTMNDIVSFYDISESECLQKLARLDRLQLIELLPNNRIKLKVAPNFHWQENGPIQSFFQEKLGQDFLKGSFNRDEECLIVLNGMLSPQSNAEFQRRLRRLAWEFNLFNTDDSPLPLQERGGVTVVMAMRAWQYGMLHPLRKQ